MRAVQAALQGPEPSPGVTTHRMRFSSSRLMAGAASFSMACPANFFLVPVFSLLRPFCNCAQASAGLLPLRPFRGEGLACSNMLHQNMHADPE
jgi:hypothetical protein